MQSLSFLWVIDFDYPTRLHHGGVIRFLNYSRELLLRGHRVYFAIFFDPAFEDQSRLWFESLKEQGIISGFEGLSYSPSRRHYWLAARAIHPRVGNWVLRKFQRATTGTVEDLIARFTIDIVIVSNRRLLFLVAALSSRPSLIDFCDCASLYLARELRHFARTRQYRRLLRSLPLFLNVICEDRYYARRGTASLVVSPVDNLALTRVAGNSPKIYTLLNGVTLPAPSAIATKIRNRLIFTGNMDFPPNYVAALWLLDQVFPRVVAQVPDAHLVLAGANPPETLKARATGNIAVTGYVEDLNHEIASSELYVAPLKSGSGFKNKIVEALANRTYVVATPVAIEFLDPFTRRLIAVADSGQEMADLIVSLLRDPAAFESRLASLHDHVHSTFTWAKRTDELLEIVEACVNRTERSPLLN